MSDDKTTPETPRAAPPGYDMSIHSNPDARAWARFFAETCAKMGKECDEEWMVGWFANAMMAMHDHLKRPAPAAPATTGAPPRCNCADDPMNPDLPPCPLHHPDAMERRVAALTRRAEEAERRLDGAHADRDGYKRERDAYMDAAEATESRCRALEADREALARLVVAMFDTARTNDDVPPGWYLVEANAALDARVAAGRALASHGAGEGGER